MHANFKKYCLNKIVIWEWKRNFK